MDKGNLDKNMKIKWIIPKNVFATIRQPFITGLILTADLLYFMKEILLTRILYEIAGTRKPGLKFFFQDVTMKK